MKIKSVLYLLLVLIFSSSCLRDDLGLDPIQKPSEVEVLPDGRLKVPLTFLLPHPAEVEIKSTEPNLPEENKLKSVLITVWEDDNNGGTPTDDSKLVEVATAVIASGTQLDVNAHVILKPYANPCNLIVMSNLPDAIETTIKGYSTIVENGEATAVTFLSFKDLKLDLGSFYRLAMNPPGKIADPPYPMVSNPISVDKIDAVSVASLPVISLDMQAARIDVTNSVSDFTIHGVTVVNGAKENFVHPYNPIPTNLGGVIQYGETAATTSPSNFSWPIYLFPNNGGGTAGTNPTYIIVRGTKTGYTTAWYKIVIRYDKNNDPCYDIVRNNLYKVKITSAGVGHTSLADAIANAPMNIDYDITVTDPNASEIHAANGYYIAFSNSESWFYGFPTSEVVGADNDYVTLTQFTVGTAAGQSLPTGTTRTLTNSNITGIANLIITDSPTGTTGTHDISSLPAGTYYLRARLRAIDMNAKVTFRFGTIIKDLFVKTYKYIHPTDNQYHAIEVTNVLKGVMESNTNDFFRFSDNTSYPSSPTPSIESTNGKIYLCSPTGYNGSSNRTAEALILRSGESGKVRVSVTQEMPPRPFSFYNADYFLQNISENCYMLPSTSTVVKYKIPIKRMDEYWNQEWRDANAAGSGFIFCATDAEKKKPSTGTWTAHILWSDQPLFSTNICSYLENVTATKSGDGEGIDVTVYSNAPASVIIAAKDEASAVLWSWHLWITDLVTYSGSTITPVSDITFPAYNSVNGYPGNIANIMNRNLGARSSGDPITHTNNANTDTYGFYYQWGRKDPFPGPDVYNTKTESTIYTPSGSGRYAAAGHLGRKTEASTSSTMALSIVNPMTFFFVTIANTSSYDWIGKRNDAAHQKMNRWLYHSGEPTGVTAATHQTNKGIKTIYDPCPKGYRVPWGINWSDIQTSNGVQNTTNFPWQAVLGSYGGRIWKPRTDNRDENTTNTTWRWFPAAGGRSGGSVGGGLTTYIGLIGTYWSGSPYNTNYGSSLNFNNNAINVTKNDFRSGGFSVRCVQE